MHTERSPHHMAAWVATSAGIAGAAFVACAVGLVAVPAHADEVFSRKGLDPSQQSKVTRVMARERIQRAAGEQSAPGQASANPARKPSECRTDIGNVDNSNTRPGQRGPKENIVVIKAPVVNSCR